MSISTHYISDLLYPLREIDERIYHIRKGSALYAVPKNPIVLMLLEADHEMTIETGQVLRVKTGDVCLFPPALGRRYEVAPGSESRRMVALRIDIHSYQKEHGILAAAQPMQYLQEKMSTFRHLPGFITPRLYERIADYRKLYEQATPGYQLKVSLLWLSFLADLMSQQPGEIGKADKPKRTKGEILIDRTKAYILDNFRKAITLDEIAWGAKVSREHLARTFKEGTGKTVFEYLLMIRLEAAQQMLADSSLPVGEIARRCGFSSATLLWRVFKREVGVSPQSYRQSVLSGMKSWKSIMV